MTYDALTALAFERHRTLLAEAEAFRTAAGMRPGGTRSGRTWKERRLQRRAAVRSRPVTARPAGKPASDAHQ